MSSSKTANLQLNQWAATDSFLREEFNRDNGKIDAAMGAVTSGPGIEKLMDITTTGTLSAIALDLSTLDWSKYMEVRFSVWLYCPGATGNHMAYVRVNNHSEYNDYYAGNPNPVDSNCIAAFYISTPTQSSHCVMTVDCFCPPFAITSRSFQDGRYAGTGGAICKSVRDFSAVKTINLVCGSAYIGAGSKVVVYGVRK